jgi:hypothetical protein
MKQSIALLTLVIRDYHAYLARGVEFVGQPKQEPY